MRISRILLMVLTLPVMFLAACSAGEDAPVASVNDRKISMKDYEKAWATVDPQFLPATTDLAGRKEFLDIMVNKEVMAIKADELGYDKDTYVVQGMVAFRKVGLQAAYLKFNVMDRINVTDAVVQEYYKMWGKRLGVKQILCDTQVDADEVYEMLQEGHDFETVCRERSKGPDAAEGGRVDDHRAGEPELLLPVDIGLGQGVRRVVGGVLGEGVALDWSEQVDMTVARTGRRLQRRRLGVRVRWVRHDRHGLAPSFSPRLRIRR